MHSSGQDAADITDGDLLLRRVTPSQHMSETTDGTRILTSFAFREKNHEFSMYVAAEVSREKLLSGPPCGFPEQIIVELTAGEVRSRGYAIVRDPDECDDSHVYARAKEHKSRGQIEKDCKTFAELVNRRRMSRGTGAAGSP